MPEPRLALLPDFGIDCAPSEVPLEPDAFIPLGRSVPGRSQNTPTVFEVHRGTVVAAAVEADGQTMTAEPSAHHHEPVLAPTDAAALQTMLSDAFAGDSSEPVEPRDENAQTAAGPSAPPLTAMTAEAAALAAQLDQERATVAELRDQIDAIKAAHDAELAQVAAQATNAMAETVATAVMDALAPVLAHPLFEATAATAVDRFRQELVTLLTDTDAVSARVTGPADRLDQLRSNWPESIAMPDLIQADTFELTALVDRNVLSTRLEELRAILLEGRP